MRNNDYIIRLERKEEQFAVETLVRESFWNVYRPGCAEHFVLHYLRAAPDFIPELNYVLEKEGRLIGQTVFVRAHISADDGRNIPILTMGPICIAPDEQRKGFGKLLLEHGLKQAQALGFGAVCFEGNIDFYGKSGFTYARKFGLRYHGLPQNADDSFFLCKELKKGYLEGVQGEYQTPACYAYHEEELEEFDRQFPEKKKERLSFQIF